MDANSQCDICQYVYVDEEDVLFHGYVHFGLKGLQEFALSHRAHITKPFDMNAYELGGCPFRSFNFPLQPEERIDEQLIESCLFKILKTLGTSFKVRVGLSRILTTRVPTPKPLFKFYRCEHDNFQQKEVEGVIKNLREDKSNVSETGLSGLHPHMVHSWSSCQQVSTQKVEDIDNSMLDDRPDSQYMVVTATNIRMYCYLVDLPVGHFNYNLPREILLNQNLEDVMPPSRDNLCLFRCIVKKCRPEESQADRERRVKLMWF